MTVPVNVQRPGFSEQQAYLVLQKGPTADDLTFGVCSAGSQDTLYCDLIRRWASRRLGAAFQELHIKEMLKLIFDTIAEEMFESTVIRSVQAV